MCLASPAAPTSRCRSYHCAVTRFRQDTPAPCADPSKYITGAGCAPPGNATCEPACPAKEGLLWDHCKGCTPQSEAQLLKHPDLVDVNVLADYARATAARGAIDPVEGLATMRSYLYGWPSAVLTAMLARTGAHTVSTLPTLTFAAHTHTVCSRVTAA